MHPKELVFDRDVRSEIPKMVRYFPLISEGKWSGCNYTHKYNDPELVRGWSTTLTCHGNKTLTYPLHIKIRHFGIRRIELKQSCINICKMMK